MNGEHKDNIDNWADWEDYDETLDEAIRPVCMTGRTDSDEMTEADWDRYSREFESRYNEHLRSIKSSSPRHVGRACTVGKRVANRYYYDDNDDIGLFLPTEEEIIYYRRALGCDEEYNLRSTICEMCRPHEDTMASFFLESQW